MSVPNNIIKEFKLNTLAEAKYTFNIPLYQRKYAWTSDEVNILLNDLKAAKDKGLTDYFIGNIVVENKDGIFDIIDGQQRFTTLYLMAKIAGQQYYELIYEIRDADREFLENFTYTDGEKIEYKNSDSQFKKNIEAIKDFLTSNNVGLLDLLKICKITLTILPDGIDIVKYFEVMNNRGRQLEKHQILKATFLRVLKDDTSCIDYAKIWDYCSNMNLYVEDMIYYNDEKKEDKDFQELRMKLINFIIDNKIEYLKDCFKKGVLDSKTILEILKPEEEKEWVKEDIRFKTEYSSIVKFPIFLIQVLKIYLANEPTAIHDIIVNDGYLIEHFNKGEIFLFNKPDDAKKFILFLLKMRILYDYFIFKRDEKGEPFLDGLIFEENSVKFSEGENKKSLMLQLLFNFTAPQFVTQDWIAVVLKWLDNSSNKLKNENFYEEYFKLLENFDRAMAKTRIAEKPLLGQINHYLKKSEFENFDIQFNDSFLNNGTATPHYWFYKLDYLLWKDDNIWTEKLENKFQESNRFKFNTIKTNFRLSRLNSIEHIHPQNNNDWECLDNFGNLALISNHMNSSLSDKIDSKRGLIQIQLDNGTIESLKMILVYSKYTEWNKDNCQKHQEEMKKFYKTICKNKRYLLTDHGLHRNV